VVYIIFGDSKLVRIMLFYVEIAMQKAVVKQGKRSVARVAKPWYFAHV